MHSSSYLEKFGKGMGIWWLHVEWNPMVSSEVQARLYIAAAYVIDAQRMTSVRCWKPLYQALHDNIALTEEQQKFAGIYTL